MLTPAILLAFALSSRSEAARASDPRDSLQARIEARIATVPGAKVAVVLHELEDRIALDINGDSSFHAASTMKVPVMIELFRQFEAGHLSLDQALLVVNSFGSIVDGSNYALSPGDDSDRERSIACELIQGVSQSA